MVEFKCSCGYNNRVEERALEIGALCARCGETHTLPGVVPLDPLDDRRVAIEFREARRLIYTPVHHVKKVWATIIFLLLLARDPVFLVLGTAHAWSYPLMTVWVAVLAGAVILASSLANGSASSAFTRITEHHYAYDRIGFAAAGGFDISTWSPLLAFILLTAFYVFLMWAPLNRRPLAFIQMIRGPWQFLIELVFLSIWCARMISAIVYRRTLA